MRSRALNDRTLTDKKKSRDTTLVVLFGLVSLFNGISTFVGYLMPNLFSEKNSSGTI